MLKCCLRNVTDCETNIYTGGFSNEYSYHRSSGHPRYSDRSSDRTLFLRKKSSEKTGDVYKRQSQNGVQSYIGSGVFTLDNLKKKFNEIMSMNVTPSTGTNLLDVTIDTDLNMIDASGNVVEDTDSITAEKYYADKGIDITSEDFNSADNNSGSTDDSSDDGSYDDSSVSYTHLDVYKRQSHDTVPYACKHPCLYPLFCKNLTFVTSNKISSLFLTNHTLYTTPCKPPHCL